MTNYRYYLINLSTVNWCRDCQNEDLPFSELISRVCVDFSSCTKSHCDQPLKHSPPVDQHIKSNCRNLRARAKKKRIDELAFFCWDSESLKKSVDEQISKDHLRCQCSIEGGIACTGELFTRNENGINFNFQHFTNPDVVIKEYIKFYIYNRNRLAKVDKKKVSALCIEMSSKEIGDSKCTSLNLNKDSRISITKEKSNVDIVKPQKRTLIFQFTERIAATKNIVYEIGPIESCSRLAISKINSIEARTRMKSLTKVGPALSNVKIPQELPMSNISIENGTRVKQKGHNSIQLLPTLILASTHNQMNATVGTLKSNKQQNLETYLPEIRNGTDATTEKKLVQQLFKRRGNSPPPTLSGSLSIDKQVENVKSNWQLLRQSNHWSQGKDFVTNAHTKKLYETLEKMKNQVDRMQRAYLYPKANNYLRIGAVKTARKIPGVSLAHEAERSKLMLFPKKASKVGRTAISMKNLQQIERGEGSHRNQLDMNLIHVPKETSEISEFDTRVDTDMAGRNSKLLAIDKILIRENVVFEHMTKLQTIHEPSLRNKQTKTIKKLPLKSSNEELTTLNSDVENYLIKYSFQFRKDDEIKKHEGTPFNRLSDTVDKMLANLNIHDIGFYIDENHSCRANEMILNLEGRGGSSSSESKNCLKLIEKSELMKKCIAASSSRRTNNKKTGKTTRPNLVNAANGPSKGEGHLEEWGQIISNNMRHPTDSKPSERDDASVKLGLNDMEAQIPEQLFTQILKSDYLRKDFCKLSLPSTLLDSP